MSSWRYMVIRIGESCAEYGAQTDPEAHIETCCSFLLRELEHAGDEILLLLMQCAEELPHKSPFYGTLVGLLNLEDEEFGRKVVDCTHANLQVALESENCNKLRTLLRFLTVLMCSNVILPGALIEVFETLLSSAATTIDEEGGNPAWQARADFYILCILACLPWGGLELFERAAEELERVIVGIEAYLSIRKHVLEPAFLAFNSSEQGDGKGEEGVDMLEDLWGRIRSLADNGWKIDSVPQPHLAFEARLVTGKSHDFGPLTCPEQPDLPSTASDVTIGRQRHEADLKYPQRIRRLQIFPVSKTEENLQPIDRFVVEEYLLDVLFYLNGCRKECASYMVGLPVPFRYEYIMAETIFSQLLLLPKPPFKIIYYTLVIVDLCKALPAAFPRVVAGAVRALFDRVGDLDMECRTRLVLWFSHHLSNFQFTWPWEEWAHVLDLPKWSPQRVFTQEVLEKEMRLSYWEKIKQSMQNAPTLEELLPPKGGPCFKYSGESQADYSEAEASLSTELANMVRGKKTARDVHTWIEEKLLPVHGQKVAVEIVVQTLLHIGSKSFTHLVTVLERYGQVITKLGSDQANQILVIEEVAKLWQNSAQMTAIAIDRMMGYRIISNLAIVSWVFSAGNIEHFHTSDLPWEILRNAINKTYNRISDLRKEVASAEKSAQKAVESSINAQAELETAESLAEGVDAEEAQIEAANKVKQLKEAADRAKEEESSAQESFEAKEALLIRALRENEALFIAVYKNFSNVLMKRLSNKHAEKQAESLTPDHKDPMAVDSEEPSAMDADDDDERRNQRSVKSNGLHVQEEEQWCRCILGQVRSLTRQYATEVWPHVEKLDVEVFTGDVHPSFLRAVYSGLRRPFFQLEGL